MSSAVASATESSVSASISAASASASHAGLVDPEANKAFKIVGISLAIGSGLFIGAR
jgi:cation transporter-like permease